MRLKELIPDSDGPDCEITDITSDSRACGPGSLFIAKRGGEQFIPDAIVRGARAICADPALEVEIAKRFYGDPNLYMVGITGTNGKTTTSYLVRHLLQECDLIGTIETVIKNRSIPSTLTTPDTLELYCLFSQMEKACVMEVSSHALDQNRTAGINFNAAIFTNLSQDHLDYHGSMDNYFAAKAKLFENLQTTAILNGDCPYAKRIQTPARVLTYALDAPADLRAFHIDQTPNGSTFTLMGKTFFCPLIGRFNIANALAAIGVALDQGISLDIIRDRLETFPGVPGRLQRVPNNREIHIFIDFAHTPAALENVLKELKAVSSNRLLLTFGCGGDRDQSKRPKMGKIAKQYADHLIVTSDNPRSEDPLAICQAVAAGEIEVDRKKAIHRLIDLANPGDVILIAGKGHEKTQIFKNYTHFFCDTETVAERLRDQV